MPCCIKSLQSRVWPKAERVPIRHVKPHGALYNMAARDPGLAAAIVRAVAAFDRSLFLFAPPDSALSRAGHAGGLRVALEGFADRAYDRSGQLVSRQVGGALLEDDEIAVRQALRLAVDGEVVSLDGVVVPMRVDTICVHGDTPGAARRARRIRAALEAAGLTVSAPGPG